MSRRPLCVVLLAMLALAEPDRRISRKAIAADLWPEFDEVSAGANLRRHLSYLSTSLPAAFDECIGRERDLLWFKPSATAWCDVVEFERGTLDLDGEIFMEGFEHEWVTAQRERLRQIAIGRFMQRAERLREDGDDAGAAEAARRASALDPTDESIVQFEIEVHGERGDVASVDAAYRALERRLQDIDTAPAAETAALVARFHRLARAAAARLPRPLTSYVEPEALRDVVALISDHRLLSIVGPGGVGKTRLALEAAHRTAPRFTDGAFFVDLSTVSEGDALSDALARALGTPTGLASKGFAGIKAFLSNRRALLLLDNCEQITESCSWFLSDVLEAATHLHVIVTTREALGLRAERCYALQPLSPERSLELFADRAKNAGWEIDAGSQETQRIAAVCRRLDRLPLAVELAAGMLGTLSLSDVERQLEDGIDALRSRDATTPARHRSLPDVIAWSVSLFDEGERAAFTRLAVFAGSFSAAAANAICEVDLATLSRLVSKSVLVREDAIESRFVFLNSIGAYARGLFEAHADAAALRDAHAAWYATVAMRSRETAFWSSERVWLRDIDADFANAAAALEWSLFGGGLRENGLRLAAGLTLYFLRRGFFADGSAWVRAALALAAPGSAHTAELLYCLSEFEKVGGRFERALECARESREIFSKRGNDRDTARAFNAEAANLTRLWRIEEANIMLRQALPIAELFGDVRTEATILSNIAFIESLSDPAFARRSFQASLRKFEEIGDEHSVAYILSSIATLDYNAANYEFARENVERALDVYRAMGDSTAIAGLLSDLGDVAIMQDDPARARDRYAEAFDLCIAHKLDQTYGYVLSGCAALAIESERLRDAARLLGAAGTAEGQTKTDASRRVADRVRQRLEQLLGNDTCVREIAFGRVLSRREATTLARSVLSAIASAHP